MTSNRFTLRKYQDSIKPLEQSIHLRLQVMNRNNSDTGSSIFRAPFFVRSRAQSKTERETKSFRKKKLERFVVAIQAPKTERKIKCLLYCHACGTFLFHFYFSPRPQHYCLHDLGIDEFWFSFFVSQSIFFFSKTLEAPAKGSRTLLRFQCHITDGKKIIVLRRLLVMRGRTIKTMKTIYSFASSKTFKNREKFFIRKTRQFLHTQR